MVIKFSILSVIISMLVSICSYGKGIDQQDTNISPVLADSRLGVYFGGQIVPYGHDLPEGASIGDTLFGSRSIGLGAVLGYQFNRYFALEGSFYYYNGSSSNTYSGDTSIGPEHHYLYSGAINAKFLYPVSRRFTVFGLTGIALTHEDTYNKVIYSPSSSTVMVDQQNNRLMPQVGVGMEFYLTPSFSLSSSMIYMFKNNINSITYFPIGVNYHF
ncbi:outer membrane beta-barrel protein [Piscirickettsia salmonis]|uniref:outer membrane beta-barrel protein n=1 Tax=Piscirickettsia salmonis TaxID=1238 RepID=UPI000F09288B|nr:hypothetical protein DA717_05275 [Piscirickettsiaceae bacterium NZ-RLO2]